MKLLSPPVLVSLALIASAPALRAGVTPHPLFSDNAVLQQGVAVPVWGTAADGEQVTVEFAGQRVATTARDGRWSVRLQPLAAGGPHTMTIAGTNAVTLSNILVGEVWICSGQSNMERHLGLQPGQKPIVGWEKAVAAANLPRIRHFKVANRTSPVPLDTVDGTWAVCSPETVAGFTAIGYFFGRDLHAARDVPIGLIHTSWGGTPAEAWTSREALQAFPEFAEAVAGLDDLATDVATANARYRESLGRWFTQHDAAASREAAWASPALDETGWPTMTVPALWEDSALPGFDGVAWMRRSFDLPAAWAGRDLVLRLSAIDDIDTTWVNGERVGETMGYIAPRRYTIPASALKPGRNVIAVRVLDTGGGGGIWEPTIPLDLGPADGSAPAISLAGAWLVRASVDMKDVPPPPTEPARGPNMPTVLYNAMVAPLQPYAMRGAIWYQGESNSGRALQYRTLFPALIADWRRAWGAEFPFLFVQIAPHSGMSPEIREAQLLTMQCVPGTAMAVTLDCGDANDIHPANKEPVGARLALAARAVAYGEPIEYSGPVFASMRTEGARAILSFTHVGGGLVAKDGALAGFVIAGSDGVFRPAQATIEGDTVIVSANEAPAPVAVRYAWANVPEGNLFNRAGLPASPFRTDVK